jgi:hypothetical protein
MAAELQGQVAGAARRVADGQRVRLPDEFARLCASYAYLGELDVRPLTNPAGGAGTAKRCELWATRTSGSPNLYRLEGVSDLVADPAERPDGAVFHHTIKLQWEGFLQLQGSSLNQLVLSARGREVLKWRSGGNGDEPLVARLPAGRNLDQSTEVRFGLIGKPYSGPAPASAPEEDGLPPLDELLGPAFLVDTPTAQADLQLTSDQQARLRPTLAEIRKTVKGILQGTPGPEVGHRVQELRPAADRKLRDALSRVLTAAQQRRLREIELQRHGAFALGDPQVAALLGLSGEQRQQLQNAALQTQQRLQAVQRQAMAAGDPLRAEQLLLQVRRQHEEEVMGLLTADQRLQWKALQGKPFVPQK